MWIKIQREDRLIKCSNIGLTNQSHTYGHSIICLTDKGSVVLGEFRYIEQAKKVFDEIRNCLADGKNYYEIPKSEYFKEDIK